MSDNQRFSLIIDDLRTLQECYNAAKISFDYRDPSILLVGNWVIVRTYDDFINYINEHGLPDVISYDHDLADFVEVDGVKVERTGKTCAEWLVNYCMDNNVKLPDYHVHSSNPCGVKNIMVYLDNYKRLCE